MFLTKVTLKQGPELFNLLKHKSGTDGYVAHQILWDLFPNDGDKKRDFIFHKEDKSGLPSFFVVSKDKPTETEALSIQTKEYNPKLSVGQKLAFILIANPVISRKVEGKKNSIKHDVWMDAKKQKQKELSNSVGVFEVGMFEVGVFERTSNKRTSSNTKEIQQACETASKEWLVRQGERCGFSVSTSDILIDGYQQNRFYKGRGKSPIRFSSIHYEGVLTVTDVEKFISMLGEGIGKSKAFGCGLMLVRKV